MSTFREQLEYATRRLVHDLGVRVREPAVMAEPTRDVLYVEMWMPLLRERVEIKAMPPSRCVGAEFIDDMHAARDRLFEAVQAHIASYGDSRVRQLTSALGEALTLLRSRSLAYGPDEWADIGRLQLILSGGAK